MRIEITETEFGRLYKEATEGSFLKEVLDRKVDAMLERELYRTAYKDKKATPEEREQARREYLESRGIPFH